ncbi:hypothetical protein BDF22DRAFT_657425 [Syncephalis plumigaleata]|nr:hypothetical protein BDF22DRAFT_657425 [Syncephalis plumigaleata]
MEYAATFQVADFEQRLGLKRGSSFRGLTPEEIEDLDTSMPGSSAVIGMAFDLAEQFDTAQYQRSGAPLVPELVSIFLTPDDYPNAWDKVWGITSTVLSFIPIPGVMEIFKMGAVSLIGQITADVNEHRKAKPATPTELSAWLRFALEQCDYTADSLYKSFLEVFRQARIGQLRTLLEEFRAEEAVRQLIQIGEKDNFYNVFTTIMIVFFAVEQPIAASPRVDVAFNRLHAHIITWTTMYLL